MQHEFETKHEENLEFAASDRLSFDQIQKQQNALLSNTAIAQIIEAVPLPLIFFNSSRQLIYANRKALDITSTNSLSDAMGLRMGEFLGYDHHLEGLECSKEECQNCNAMEAIVGAIRGTSVIQDKKLVMHPETPQRAVYQISGTPVSMNGSSSAMLCLQKIEA